MVIFDLDMIRKVYASYPERVAAARKMVHERGKSYVDFAPDRIPMQDATSQIAFNDLTRD